MEHVICIGRYVAIAYLIPPPARGRTIGANIVRERELNSDLGSARARTCIAVPRITPRIIVLCCTGFVTPATRLCWTLVVWLYVIVTIQLRDAVSYFISIIFMPR